MLLTSTEYEALNEEKLKDFLELQIDEFYYLDYKETIEYNDHFKEEFLKDISAFANAFGGNIIYGVKEPDPNLDVTDQIVGVHSADNLISKFEKLAYAGLDPRIPGFKMRTVKIEGADPVIIAHIPPSISKPHMIIHDNKKKYLFYKRGIESNQIMNTQQIKNAVLATIDIERKIHKKLQKREEQFRKYKQKDIPTFYFQAIPLLDYTPDKLLNENEVREAFRHEKRRSPYYDLRRGHQFSPVMHGFKAVTNPERSYYHRIEIHHDGYIESIFEIPPYNEDKSHPVNIEIGKYFNSILKLTDDLINNLKFDFPYLLVLKSFNANHFIFTREFDKKIRYEVPIMDFTKETRNIGESVLENAHKNWVMQFYNAFEQYPPKDLMIVNEQ